MCSDNVPAQAHGLSVNCPLKVVEHHPVDSNSSPLSGVNPPMPQPTIKEPMKKPMAWETEHEFCNKQPHWAQWPPWPKLKYDQMIKPEPKESDDPQAQVTIKLEPDNP
jgi:hypothetical protein